MAARERVAEIDALRGLALFGVCLVNLVTIFRVSIFRYLDVFYTEPGTANAVAQWVIAMLFESKAFAIFSLLFGVGLSIFRQSHGTARLARRLAVLLFFGLAHVLLVWNGDILTAYALGGFLALPFLGRKSPIIPICVGIIYCLPLPIPDVLPHNYDAHVYATGTWTEIFHFRLNETRHYIAPLLLLTLPRIWALLLLGDWAWRRQIHRDRRKLRVIAWVGLGIGGSATLLEGIAAQVHVSLGPVEPLVSSLSNVPFGLGYAAAFFLLAGPRLVRWLAPVGRMALTNYLTQSLICSLIFYGFGFGLFDRIGAAAGAGLAIAIYLAQCIASHFWLQSFRFGPFERIWRAFTYGS
jgi:uncharacterized protein